MKITAWIAVWTNLSQRFVNPQILVCGGKYTPQILWFWKIT